MDYRDEIIRELAERACQKVARKVIRSLQGISEGRQSGHDSPLKDIWDEICVQVQNGEAISWDLYLDMARSVVAEEVNKLPTTTKHAIWLQTEAGMDWQTDEDNFAPGARPSDDVVVDFLLQDYVLRAAGDWSNRRIRAFVESTIEFG
jgi:hypothetical protein